MAGGIKGRVFLSILKNLSRVRERINTAAFKSGRDPAEIQVVAVTKTVPVSVIREVTAYGVTSLGENRVQEFLRKYHHLPSETEWHFIGHLQINKVKKIIGKVKLIHSLDRWALAEAINRAAGEAGCVADVLIQVNVAGEKTKHGLSVPEVKSFVADASKLPGLNIRGLMTIAPICNNPDEVRPVFRQMWELFNSLKECYGAGMEFLSMGMSGDYEVAIEEGANILRIGTSIFGTRY